MELCVLVRHVKEPYIFVSTGRSWERCLKELQEAPRLAVDLEANGLYVYREKICLIQVSTDKRHYIIDPMARLPLDGLGEILADPGIEKVFHAVDYDLTLLKNHFQWELRGLFDTMRAAEMLGHKSIGLAALLKFFYGVTLSKKYQKANWGLRPLSAEQLLYAYNDTCHLLFLRDDLAAGLEENGLMEQAREAFDLVCLTPPAEREFSPDHFWRIQGVGALSRQQQAVVKALFVYREKEAKKQDLPPFKIMPNSMLLALARQSTRLSRGNGVTLTEERDIPVRLLKRYYTTLMQTIEQGLTDPIPMRPVFKHAHSDGFSQRLEKLQEWRKQEAQRQGVPSQVVLPRGTMNTIAEENPGTLEALSRIHSLGPLCCSRYGEEILEALRSAADSSSSDA